jgi:hypothetical protein
MRIERIWAMPNKWTFRIKPIADLLQEEMATHYLRVDPFAGQNSPAAITNDLRPEMPTEYHSPALTFLRMIKDESFDGVLYDPPYSPRQVKECYDDVDNAPSFDGRANFWSDTLTECARILKPGGKLICFGWNSMGGTMSRGFELKRILLVPHGGRRNDTIVTVELKATK